LQSAVKSTTLRLHFDNAKTREKLLESRKFPGNGVWPVIITRSENHRINTRKTETSDLIHVKKPFTEYRPVYDDFSDAADTDKFYTVKIARDFEDMAKVIAIRASACFSDPEHLYAKHFDGNDFSATHLVGHIGREPVAAIRIRYFAGFARIERLTVRPTHRRSRIAFRMVQAAFAFCRDKGFRRLSGVAREEMVPFWSLFGGQVSRGKEPIHIYGLPHFEMFIDFPELPGAITESADPLVLLRPEGRWREVGQHEKDGGARPAPVTDPAPSARRVRRPAEVAHALGGRGRPATAQS
jgi:GNAT superfamily N-acetyltransferase